MFMLGNYDLKINKNFWIPFLPDKPRCSTVFGGGICGGVGGKGWDIVQLGGKPGGVGVHIHPNIQGPAKHGGPFGLFWGRGMLCKARTAEAIGPHHLGKHGKAWRCPGGSRRLRAGTGERERSESAMIDAGSLMGQWLKQLFQAKINV